MCDWIYKNFCFVVRAFELKEKYKKVYSVGEQIAFFVMIRVTEIAISHWILNRFQSSMYHMPSKMYDPIYQALYFDVGAFESMQKSLIV